MTWLAGVIVAASGLWLVGLAVAIVLAPVSAERFLSAFASSARAHCTEQSLRLFAGAGMIFFAHEMRFPHIFNIFGWVLVITAAALLVVPWTWHHQFGKWAIPLAIKYKKFYALGSLALGLFIIYSML
jgi:hypothetical protein